MSVWELVAASIAKSVLVYSIPCVQAKQSKFVVSQMVALSLRLIQFHVKETPFTVLQPFDGALFSLSVIKSSQNSKSLFMQKNHMVYVE